MTFLSSFRRFLPENDSFIGTCFHYSLLAMLVAVPLAAWSGTADPASLVKLAVGSGIIALSAVFWFIRMLVAGEIRLHAPRLSVPFILLAAVTCVSAVLSLSPTHAFLGQLNAFSFAGGTVIILILWSWFAIQDIAERGSVVSYIGAWLATLSLGLIMAAVEPANAPVWWPRLSVLPSTTTVIAALSGIIALMVLVAREQHAILRYISMVALAVAAYTLIRYDFTVGWVIWTIGIVALFAFGAVRFMDGRRWWLTVSTVSFLIGLAGIVWTVPAPVRLPLPTEVMLGISPSWHVARNTIFHTNKQLLVGSGPGTFAYDAAQFRLPIFNENEALWQARFDSAVNSILTMLAETGVAGVLSWFVIVAVVIGLWQKTERNNRLLSFDSDRSTVRLAAMVWLVATAALFVTALDMTGWFAWWFTLTMLAGTMLIQDEIALGQTARVSLSDQMQFVFGVGGMLAVIGLASTGVLAARAHAANRQFTEYSAMISGGVTIMNTVSAGDMITQIVERWPHEGLFWQKRAEWLFVDAKIKAQTGATSDDVMSELSAAIEDAREAVRRDPGRADAWNTLATLYVHSKTTVPEATAKAREALMAAIEREPTNALLPWRLATLYQSEKQWLEAEQAVYQALNLKSNYVDAYVTLAQIYEAQGWNDRALAVYEQSLPITINNPIALTEIGRLLYNRRQSGDIERAREAWTTALKLQPNYANAIYSMALLERDLGNVEAAEEYALRLQLLGVDISKLEE